MSFKTAFLSPACEYGFEDAEASLEPFVDFKIRWARSMTWISLEVSDYLAEMPDDLARALGDTVFARIRGESHPYPEEVKEWIRTEVPRLHRDTFFNRLRNLRQEGTGGYTPSVNSIADALDTIRSKGIDVPEDVVFGWDLARTRDTAVRYGTVFRYVQVPVSKDRVSTTADEFAYSIFDALCRVEAGFDAPQERYEELCDRWTY